MQSDQRYVPSGCATAGMLHRRGELIGGEAITRMIANMRDRGNGLGGGFVGYGIYPQMKDCYAFHVMFDREGMRSPVEELLERKLTLIRSERIPTLPTAGVGLAPLFWRYFLRVPPNGGRPVDESDDDYVVRVVMRINQEYEGAYVVSCGKNMGVFKGVGHPEDIGRYFRLEEYQAYLWIAHTRFPTNTPAWWGGAHPFNLLDWSVGPQWRAIILWYQQALCGAVRLSLYVDHRYGGARLLARFVSAPAEAALGGHPAHPGASLLGATRSHGLAAQARHLYGVAPGVWQRVGEWAIQHHCGAQPRFSWSDRSHQAAAIGCGRGWRNGLHGVGGSGHSHCVPGTP